MPKALELNMDTMTAPPIPKAAQTAAVAVDDAAPVQKSKRGREGKPEKVLPKEPLQVRWPVADVKAMKLAAIELDFPSVSDFMLTCFHAYMQNPGSRK